MTQDQTDGMERAMGRIEGLLEGFGNRFSNIERKLDKIDNCVRDDGQRITSLEEFKKNLRNKTLATGGVSGAGIVTIIEVIKHFLIGR